MQQDEPHIRSSGTEEEKRTFCTSCTSQDSFMGKGWKGPDMGHPDRPCRNLIDQHGDILDQLTPTTRIEHLRSQYPQIKRTTASRGRNAMSANLTPVFQACPPRHPDLTGSSYAADLHRAIRNEVATSAGRLGILSRDLSCPRNENRLPDGV